MALFVADVLRRHVKQGVDLRFRLFHIALGFCLLRYNRIGLGIRGGAVSVTGHLKSTFLWPFRCQQRIAHAEERCESYSKQISDDDPFFDTFDVAFVQLVAVSKVPALILLSDTTVFCRVVWFKRKYLKRKARCQKPLFKFRVFPLPASVHVACKPHRMT